MPSVPSREDTEQRLARAQDDLSQRSLDAAEALTELGEELAKACLGDGAKCASDVRVAEKTWVRKKIDEE